jgi:hypothetical protein
MARFRANAAPGRSTSAEALPTRHGAGLNRSTAGPTRRHFSSEAPEGAGALGADQEDVGEIGEVGEGSMATP